MSVWRMSIIVEMEAENIDQAESIGRVVWERCAPVVKGIEGAKWMLPVGDFKERGEFPEHPADSQPEDGTAA